MLKYIYNDVANSFSPPHAKSILEAQAGQRLVEAGFVSHAGQMHLLRGEHLPSS